MGPTQQPFCSVVSIPFYHYWLLLYSLDPGSKPANRGGECLEYWEAKTHIPHASSESTKTTFSFYNLTDTRWIHWTKSPYSGLPRASLSLNRTVCGAAAAGDASDWWLHLCFCPSSSGTWKVWKWKVSLGDSSLKNKREGFEKNTFLPAAPSVSVSFDWEFPHTLACATRCWFTPTAGSSRGDPPRMSSKNSTLSLSSGGKQEGRSMNSTGIVHYDAYFWGHFCRNYVLCLSTK